MRQWEYRLIQRNQSELVELQVDLNERGLEGFDAVSMVKNQADGVTILLKRERQHGTTAALDIGKRPEKG